MTKFPTDPSLPTLPGTIPINSRLRLLASMSSLDDSEAESNSAVQATREQLLRAKQLLLQLKELANAGLNVQEVALPKNLALLRLTIRSLELGDLTLAQLDDIRMVLDEVTRQLNLQSQVRRSVQHHDEQRHRLTEWFENAIAKDTWPLEDIRELACELYRDYLFLAPPLSWYKAPPEEPFLWAASHGLNTAQVLQRMLHPAQHTSRHVLNAILAGLLHDLGMARLPTKVLAAQVRTDPTSKQQWRNHSTWLAERLRPHLKPEELDVGLAIAQHHERLDATGYPLKLKQGELIELGRQLAVADTYAALCQARPHRPAQHTRQATQLVLKEAQWGRLDQLAALMLIPWGMAPVGSKVELSDGSEGEVISWAHVPLGTNTLRPVVALHQQNRGKILDLDLVRDRHIIRIINEEQKKAS